MNRWDIQKLRNHLNVSLMGLILGIGCSVFARDLPQASFFLVQKQRVEIVIRNSKFVISERSGLQFGLPTAIILRNQDIIRYGFTSPILVGLSV